MLVGVVDQECRPTSSMSDFAPRNDGSSKTTSRPRPTVVSAVLSGIENVIEMFSIRCFWPVKSHLVFLGHSKWKGEQSWSKSTISCVLPSSWQFFYYESQMKDKLSTFQDGKLFCRTWSSSNDIFETKHIYKAMECVVFGRGDIYIQWSLLSSDKGTKRKSENFQV